MTWPTVAVDTTDTDAGTDNPATARADLLDAIQKLNQIIAHVSAYFATLLDDANAAGARGTLGSTTVGDALFIAASASAARAALGATSVGDALIIAANAAAGRSAISAQLTDADLDALAALAGTGIAVRSAANTWVQRTLTAPASQRIIFTNPDGVAGNPVIDVWEEKLLLQNLGGAVNASRIGTAAVEGVKLWTTTGDVSTTAQTPTELTLAGGDDGFYPLIKTDNASFEAGVGVNYNTALGRPSRVTHSTTLIASINLASESGGTATLTQRYMLGSPPYDLGDGEIPLFVFAMVDRSGKVLATYSAIDPPWAHNGPTSIRWQFEDRAGKRYRLQRPKLNRAALLNPARREAELARFTGEPEVVEITQAVKQADMPLIPHPFVGNDLSDKTIVLLDPVSALAERLLRLHEEGEGIGGLLHDDYLRMDNVPLKRAGPHGVLAVAGRWK